MELLKIGLFTSHHIAPAVPTRPGFLVEPKLVGPRRIGTWDQSEGVGPSPSVDVE